MATSKSLFPFCLTLPVKSYVIAVKKICLEKASGNTTGVVVIVGGRNYGWDASLFQNKIRGV